MNKNLSLIEIGKIIYFIRGHRVMLDSDLAQLYQVETKALKRAVRRNMRRFPPDFAFELSSIEYENLRYQFGTSSFEETAGHGGVRYLPFVFTEHGVAMLSSVLNSERAIIVNIEIMRTFVELRGKLEDSDDVRKKIEELKCKFIEHDQKFVSVFEAIRQIMEVGTSLTRKRIKTLAEK